MHDRKDQFHQGKPCNPNTEKSRELQRKLYLAAKRNRNQRFHALYDRLYWPEFFVVGLIRHNRIVDLVLL